MSGRWFRSRQGRAVTVVFLATALAFALAHDTARAQAGRGFTVAAGAHALTVPWYPGPVVDRFNPAVMAGWDRDWRSSEHWRLYWAVNLGFFRHHWWMTGLSVEPEVGVSRSVPGGFHTDLSLGLGYLHYFWRRPTMELEDGRYVEATDFGRPSLLVPVSMTVGYRGAAENPAQVQPFLTARWGVQGLFQPEVAVMTHLRFMGGVRIEGARRDRDGER